MPSRVLTRRFQRAGDDVVLLGENAASLAAASTCKSVHGLLRGVPPALDLARERALQRCSSTLAARRRLIASAHDCAEGGIAVTLAECCFEHGRHGRDGRSAAVTQRPTAASMGLAATLFGESASRVIVSAAPEQRRTVLEAARGARRAGDGDRPTGGDRRSHRAWTAGMRDRRVALRKRKRVWSTSLANW